MANVFCPPAERDPIVDPKEDPMESVERAVDCLWYLSRLARSPRRRDSSELRLEDWRPLRI